MKMAKINLFSFRKKQAHGDTPDVYEYEVIPQKLKIQIIHILKDTIGIHYGDSPLYGNYEKSDTEIIYEQIDKILCKEYGLLSLSNDRNKRSIDKIFNYFLNSEVYEESIDIIELACKFMEKVIKVDQDKYTKNNKTLQTAETAINEINLRFRENGIGYEYVAGEVIRVDSHLIHSEVVKPTFGILQGSIYLNGAREEFLSAHKHYRQRHYKECLNDCLKSFESTMKAICKKQNWEYGDTFTAKKLINVCLTNNLIPSYMQEQFSQFRGLLESGVPTVRNKESGHGQGSDVKNVSADLASYTLHLTATNILFLCECEKKL